MYPVFFFGAIIRFVLCLQNNIQHVLIDVNFQHPDKCSEFMKRQRHKEVPVLVDGAMIVFEA